jgi:hypothetical protein
MRKQRRPRKAALDRARGCWSLHDRIATRTGHLGTDMLDHLKVSGYVLECFRDVITQVLQLAAAARTGLFRRRGGLRLARKMFRKDARLLFFFGAEGGRFGFSSVVQDC